MKRKEVDDVLGGEETWRDADSTASQFFFFHHVENQNTNLRPVVTCDKCGHSRAYFYQLQIRSADEPMTTCTYFLCIELA